MDPTKKNFVDRCANCPFTARDRKMLTEIQMEKGFLTKRKKVMVTIKEAIDTIYGPAPATSQPLNSDDDTFNVGVCEACAEILTDLYTCHEAFAATRESESYIAKRIRKIKDKIVEACPADSVLMVNSVAAAASGDREELNLAGQKGNDAEETLVLEKITDDLMGGGSKFDSMVRKSPRVRLVRLEAKDIRKTTFKRPAPSLKVEDQKSNGTSGPMVVRVDTSNDRSMVITEPMPMTLPLVEPGPSAGSSGASAFVTTEKMVEEKKEWLKKILERTPKSAGRQKCVATLKILKCPACVPIFGQESKVYKSPKDFYLHLTTHLQGIHKKQTTTRNTFKCPVCSIKLTASGIYVHLRIHADYKPYKCTFSGCPLSFTTNDRRQKHVKSGHGTRHRKIRSTGQIYRLKGVKNEKKKGTKFTCQHCDRECVTQQSLDNHIRRKHDDDDNPVNRPINCDLCQHSFFDQWGLDHHVKRSVRHQRMVQFGKMRADPPVTPTVTPRNDPIDDGDEKVNEEEGQDHDQGQQGVGKVVENNLTETTQPAVPQEDEEEETQNTGHDSDDVPLSTLKIIKSVSLTTTSVDQMRPNLRSQTRKRKACPICGKFMVGLSQHMVMAHNMLSKKEFLNRQDKQCQTCHKIFSTAERLKTHQEIHGEDRHACQLCDKQFVSLERLRRHVKRSHVEVDDEDQE